MIKVIGLILLIYGIAGVIGTFIVYGTLRGPIDKLRKLLRELAPKVGQGGEAAAKVSHWVGKGSGILQTVADIFKLIVGFVREIAKRFGEAAGLLKSVEAALDPIKVPMLTFQTRTLELTIGSVSVITGIHMKKYGINLPGPGGNYDLYGPPLTLDTTTIGLNLGNVPVVTGINMTNVYPLQPVGDVFRFAGERVEAAQQEIDKAGDRVEDVKERVLEAKENVDRASENLKDLADRLNETSDDLLEISKSRVLSLIPALVLGYFGLIHLAFALTGLALLLNS
jgi:hypothetical protein